MSDDIVDELNFHAQRADASPRVLHLLGEAAATIQRIRLTPKAVARVINDNQPGNTAIIEVFADPPTLSVGTSLALCPVHGAERTVIKDENGAWLDWFGRAQPFDGVEEAFRAGFRAASAPVSRS